jgi:hypothetical protein
VAAAVDDIERRHWQHKVSVASQVSEVLVQWHSLSQCNAEKKKKAHHKLAVNKLTCKNSLVGHCKTATATAKPSSVF